MSKNIFHYLNKFKQKTLNMIKRSYEAPEKIKNIDNQVEAMFLAWYMNSIVYYVPKNNLDVKSDLLYQNNKYGFKVPINEIANKINEYVKELNIKIDNINDNVDYEYKDIFSDHQLELLKVKYTGPHDKFQRYVNFLSELYEFIGGFNNHLSIPPEISKDFFELFGTPINTASKLYCSPFLIEKNFFSSKGSFFNYNITSGQYIANPPFNIDIYNKMVKRLLSELQKETTVDIIIIFPIWNDVDFDTLYNSKYHIKHLLLDRNKVVFYNYYSNKYHSVVDCNCIHISNYNTKFSLDSFIRNWQNISILHR